VPKGRGAGGDDIAIAVLCVGRADGERILGSAAPIAFGYDKLAESGLEEGAWVVHGSRLGKVHKVWNDPPGSDGDITILYADDGAEGGKLKLAAQHKENRRDFATVLEASVK
jgi:hypothetical protein